MSDPGLHLGWKGWKTWRRSWSRPIPTLWLPSRKHIFRGALRGSFWSAVWSWMAGALLYTLLLFAFAVGLASPAWT